MAWGVEQIFKPVFDIRVSSKIVQLAPKVEFKNEVITIRTLLCADVRTSRNLGQTHAKCVRDSGTASEQYEQNPTDWRFGNFDTVQMRLDRVGSSIHSSHIRYSIGASANEFNTVAPSLR